eukprot:COSAG02_NODE_55988_length_287_cov_1.632979_1_plen_37_part_01
MPRAYSRAAALFDYNFISMAVHKAKDAATSSVFKPAK